MLRAGVLMLQEAAPACDAAWLDLMQALLPRPAIAHALQSGPLALGTASQDAGAASDRPPPPVAELLARLMACLGGSGACADQAPPGRSALSEPGSTDCLMLPQKALSLLAVMLQMQLHPLLRWLLDRGAASTAPGLTQRLVSLLEVATRSAAGDSPTPAEGFLADVEAPGSMGPGRHAVGRVVSHHLFCIYHVHIILILRAA